MKNKICLLVTETKNTLNSTSMMFLISFFVALMIYANISGHIAPIVTMFLLFVLIVFLFIFAGHEYGKYMFNHNKHFTRMNKQYGTYAAVLISDSLSINFAKNRFKAYQKNRVVDTFVAPLFLLEKSFQNRNIAYKFIRKATESDMDKLILDDKCQELYLVGHGSRGGFTTTDKTVSYSKYQQILSKKQIVSQLHCNHLVCDDSKNQSLTEMIANDIENSHLTKGCCTFIEITYYCLKQWYKSRKHH